MLRIPKRGFGLFQSFKQIWNVPSKHVKDLMSQQGAYKPPIGNQTMQFDDAAQEWIAAVTDNAYEVNNYLNFEDVLSQGNFGTVDNPHVIFTSDIPFRFVGCTGPPNEDDLEYHELLFFLLREGPLQRCGSCGQVFKLVRLREEFSEENDYYLPQFIRTDYNELGEADHWIQQSIIRMMPRSFEHSHHEMPSNGAISLINPDDHDRLLTDPAFRLEKIAQAEKASVQVSKTFEDIREGIYQTHGPTVHPYSKDVYENVITAEIALEELGNHYKNLTRFHSRKILDAANFERREKRMLERAQQRSLSKVLYLNNVTEEELQYRDYFESDDEAISALNFNVQAAKERIMNSRRLRIENYDFQELYTTLAEPDSSSYVSRKAFRFNYRQALARPEDHYRKESRMLERFKASDFHKKIAGHADLHRKIEDSASSDVTSSSEAKYYELLINQAVANYKNYFESDLEEDFQYFESLPIEEKRDFLDTFSKNGLFTQEQLSKVAAIELPRDVDPDEGLLTRSKALWDELRDNVVPTYSELNGVNVNQTTLDRLNGKYQVNEASRASIKKIDK